MEKLSAIKVTWFDLGQTILLLVLIFFILHGLIRLLTKAPVFGNYQNTIVSSIHNILLFFEPMALLLVACYFLFINPIVHGFILGALLLVGSSFVRNYLMGKILQWDNSFSAGKQIGIDESKGIISQISRTGLYLKTGKGARFMTYEQLYNNGFTVLSGEEAGGYYQLKVKPENLEEKLDHQRNLLDALADAPYLNWNYKTEVSPTKNNKEHFLVKVFVKEEHHLDELLQLISGWGYICKIIKK